MVLDESASNVDQALFHARMLTLLRSTFPKQSMDPILSAMLPNGFQSAYFPPTGHTVGAYFGGDSSRKILYLDGVVSNTQAANLVSGYTSYLGLQVIHGPNLWIQENLATYFAMTTGPHVQAPEHMDFVGYSAGGAVAEVMMFELGRLQSVQKRKCITFGAPRPGGIRVREGLSHASLARWMTPADPIPLVPPRLLDAPAITAILPVLVTMSWANMVHPAGGVVVWDDGSTSEATVPPESQMSAFTSLADWFLSIDGDPNNPHGLQTYIQYLLAAQARFVRPNQKERLLGGGEDYDDVKKRDVNRQRDRVATAISTAQREQNATIANSPAAVLFRPVRQGRIWLVVFGDKVVCQGVREDTCRHICRAGNDFLRSLPKQGLVDPISLNEQMLNFLAYAVAPDSDWSPKLRTNLSF